jgi:protein-S-isoprenylcysteine O-methyltransferase Ste14
VILYLGEAGLLVQVWPLLFLPLVLGYVNWFVIPTEEATLAAMDGYAQYCGKVRRWL